MSNARHYHPFRGAVAAQFVGYDHTWFSSCGPQQLAKEPEPDGSKAIPFGLDQDVENTPRSDRQFARDSE